MADFKDMVFGLCPKDYTYSFGLARQAGNYKFMSAPSSVIEWRFQAEASCSVNAFGFRRDGVYGTPPVYNISLQGIANGVANGVKATAADFRPDRTWDDVTPWFWISVPPTTIVRGQYYAIVLEYVSGAVSIRNMLSVLVSLSGGAGHRFPGVATSSGGQLQGSFPIYAYKDTEGNVYGNPVRTSYSYLNSLDYTYPDKQGVMFEFPLGFGQEFQIAGMVFFGEPPEGGENTTYTMALYDAAPQVVQDEEGNPVETVDGTLLTQVSFGADQRSWDLHPNYKGNSMVYMFDASELPVLQFGHRYIVSLFCNDESMDSLSLDRIRVDDSDIAEAWPGGDYAYLAYWDDDESTWKFDKSQRPLVDFIIRDWGAPGEGISGAHLKFTPKWNDNLFVQHADDAINITPELASDAEQHESYGVPIGEAIESYSGFDTVEVFANPDAGFNEDYLVMSERKIEEAKVVNLEPWEAGLYRLVFRLRATRGSDYYKDVERYLRVIV